MSAVTFCGLSGKGYTFNGVAADDKRARAGGIDIFTANSGYGRRVIRIVEISGRAHDMRPFVALAEAERYGAQHVFIRADDNPGSRRAAMADLEAGLSPVCHPVSRDVAANAHFASASPAMSALPVAA